MVENFKGRLVHSDTKQSRDKRRAELMQLYRKASQKNFKVEREDFDNDLIISILKKYIYK